MNAVRFVGFLLGAAVGSALLAPVAQAVPPCTSTTIPAGDTCDASGLAPSGTIAFSGGTLLMNTTSQSFPQSFTLKSSTANTIDQDGNANTFSGVFSNLNTSAGNLTIANSSTNGSVTFSGANTYTGTTTINSGADLELYETGSIADSSGVADNGTFGISTATSGASIASLSGAGTVTLGSQTLTATNASGTFSGSIGGSGGLAVTGGTETLTGSNGYTGATTISNGADLKVTTSGSIASTSNVADSGTFDIQGTTAGASVDSLSGGGTVTLGGKTLTLSNASGGFSGAIGGAGGFTLTTGTETLSGANTYTGTTTINGGTLALTGSGSIADSNSVADNGTFDISGASSGASITSLSGSGTVTLGGQTLTLSKVSDTFSGVIQNSNSGTGSLTVDSTGGTETLSGVNTYTGLTTITSGTLKLSGSGSISDSSGVVDNGTLDLSAATGGATITTLSGSGTVSLGSAGSVTLSNAAGGTNGTFSGSITGSTSGSALTIHKGTEILTGTNSYNGITTIDGAATLELDGSVTSTIAVDAGGTLMGTGAIKGSGHDLTNSGTVQPGDVNSSGVLTLSHNYTQASDATLDIQIGSIVSGGLFSSLNVTSDVTLNTGSILQVNLINGFTFGEGTTGPYDILQFKNNGLTGNFSELEFGSNLCNADGTDKWTCSDGSLIVSEIVGSDMIQLNFDNLPEPGTLAILAAGLAGLGWTRRRSRRA